LAALAQPHAARTRYHDYQNCRATGNSGPG
jgi:hypothetical protein